MAKLFFWSMANVLRIHWDQEKWLWFIPAICNNCFKGWRSTTDLNRKQKTVPSHLSFYYNWTTSKEPIISTNTYCSLIKSQTFHMQILMHFTCKSMDANNIIKFWFEMTEQSYAWIYLFIFFTHMMLWKLK